MTDEGALEVNKTELAHERGSLRFKCGVVCAVLGTLAFVVACVMAGVSVDAHTILFTVGLPTGAIPVGPARNDVSEVPSPPSRESHQPVEKPTHASDSRERYQNVEDGAHTSERGSGIENAAKAFLQTPLPPRVESISVARPLVFIHQRKAGGTSLRGILAGISKDLHLPYRIMCVNADCDTYSYGSSEAAVYGGHVAWLEVSRTFAQRGQYDSTGIWREGVKQLSCMTNFRHPLTRIQSCYYFRFLQKGAPGCLADLEPQEMKRFFYDARSPYGYGCMNEPFRMLSGLVDESLFSSDAESQEWDFAFNATLTNLARCVPIIVENSSTLDIVASWFPEFEKVKRFSTVHSNTGKKKKCELSERHLEVLRDLTRNELRLYDLAVQRANQFLSKMSHGG